MARLDLVNVYMCAKTMRTHFYIVKIYNFFVAVSILPMIYLSVSGWESFK